MKMLAFTFAMLSLLACAPQCVEHYHEPFKQVAYKYQICKLDNQICNKKLEELQKK